jgi:hypothetical protein
MVLPALEIDSSVSVVMLDDLGSIPGKAALGTTRSPLQWATGDLPG